MTQDPLATAQASCLVYVLGACHSGAEALCAELAQALDATRYTLMHASPEWLAETPPPSARHLALPAPGLHCWLLTGLDLDCPPAQQARQQREDAWLRQQLSAAGQVFRVVYGSTPTQRLSQALQAIDGVASCAATARQRPRAASQRLRPWCEECSDPDCERRLFTTT